MPPPVHVKMDSPARRTQRTVCTAAKFLKSFPTWQHRFDVDSDFMLHPAPLSLVQFRPKCIRFICWW